MRLALACTSVWIAATLCGCAARGNVDMLESQLRRQEDQIFSLRRQLSTAESELVAARKESQELRARIDGPPPPTTEQLAAFHRISGLTVNKLLTGGLDRDGQPGHDRFSTVVTPVDSEGELAKAPGALHVELMDLSRDGTERLIGSWDFSEEQSEQLWKKGFFGSGYALELPFTEMPQSERLVLHVRLTTNDGRQFDVAEQFNVQTADRSAIAKRNRPVRSATRENPTRTETPSTPESLPENAPPELLKSPAVPSEPEPPPINSDDPPFGPSSEAAPSQPEEPFQAQRPARRTEPRAKRLPETGEPETAESETLDLTDAMPVPAPGDIDPFDTTDDEDTLDSPGDEQTPEPESSRNRSAAPRREALRPAARASFDPFDRPLNDRQPRPAPRVNHLDGWNTAPRSIPTSDRWTDTNRPTLR